jgi:hypothetical protein
MNTIASEGPAMKSDAWFWYLFGLAWAVVSATLIIVAIVAPFDRAAGQGPLVWLFWALGAVFLVCALAFMRLGRNVATRNRRLKAQGIRLSATVTDVRRTMVHVNNEPRWRVHYRYEYPAGRSQDGRSRMIRPQEAKRFKSGDAVSVFVNPHAPQESLLEVAD